MSAESELFAALNVASVQAKVSDRIFPDFLPERAIYPAVVWARSSTSPINSIGSIHFGDFVGFTVTSWSTTRKEADAAADAVEMALRLAGHEITGREAGADPETGLVASTVNVTVLSLS